MDGYEVLLDGVDERDNLGMTRADDQFESALLLRVLELRPNYLTASELARDLASQEPSRGDLIEAELAIRELTKAGLLHPCSAGVIRPTQAAIRSMELIAIGGVIV
jgi:hypothetical protein